MVTVGDGDFEDTSRLRDLGRLIDRASNEKAAALILSVKTTRPADWDGQQRVLDAIAKSEIPVYTYVNTSAIGPGTFLALASRKTFLAPSGILGAAGAAEEKSAEEDDEDSVSKNEWKRQTSVMKAMARSLARQNGYRANVAESFVDPDVEVKIGDRTISPEGEVLTLTAEEAIEQFDGATIFAEGISENIASLIETLDLPGDPVRTSPREFGSEQTRERLTTKGKSKSVEEEDVNEEKGPTIFGKRDGASFEDKVVVLEIGQDTLATGKAAFQFLDRAIRKAEVDGAEAIVFELDTPGGYAWYTQGLVLDSLQSVTIPTYSFVNSRAESAGAIVAMGTDTIYMRPAATIGSALVVSGTGQELSESMNSKVTQMMIAMVRNIAEIKGHNPDIAEAMVTTEKDVKIDGQLIHEAGEVLNLNTIEATEDIGGRPVLATGVVDSLEELIEREGLTGELSTAQPLGMEAFAHWVQKLSFVLIIIGLGGAYLEINSPGFGLPGLISVCAFSLFFFGNYMAGNLAGYELAVLFVLGLLLIAVEVFLFPGAIIPGAVGGALVLVSLGLAMVDRVDLEWKWDGLPMEQSWFDIFRSAFWSLAIGLAGALGAVLLGMRYLPSSKFGSRLILQDAVASGSSIATQRGETSGEESYVGWEGVATTDLVPSGKGTFDGKLLDIISEGEFIERGDKLTITRHEGSRIVVARV